MSVVTNDISIANQVSDSAAVATSTLIADRHCDLLATSRAGASESRSLLHLTANHYFNTIYKQPG